MTTKFFDRAMMTVSGSPGTGNITLGAAVPGWQSFVAAGMSDGDTFAYTIEDGTNFEYGYGTYIAASTSFSRSVTQSSSSTSPITVSSSAKVYVTILAEDINAIYAAIAAGGGGTTKYLIYQMRFKTGGTNVYGFAEISYADSSNTTQTPSSASAYQSGDGPPGNAIDGNDSTYWYAGGVDAAQNFSVIYGSQFAAKSVTIYPASPAPAWAPLTADIYGSNDGSTYVKVGSVTFGSWSASTPQTATIVAS